MFSDPAPAQTTPPRVSRAGRDLPAAIAVAVAIAGSLVWCLYQFAWGFILLAALLVTVGVLEMEGALRQKGMNPTYWPLAIGTPLVVVLPYAAATQLGGLTIPWQTMLLCVIAGTALASLLTRMCSGAEGFVRDAAVSLFLLGYLPVLGVFIPLMFLGVNGAGRVVTYLFCVIASDTGGYAFGSWLGKHALAPTISPKKTWEGLAGSIGTALVVGIPLASFALGSPWWVGAALALVAVVFATSGDLVESLIKRDIGVKDMSSILPGHGGIMERLDSVVFAAPAGWFVLYLLVPGG